MRWFWLPLLALAALMLSPVTAQPVITGWRPPTGCSTDEVIGWNGSTWVCQEITSFSTNNVIPKGNGTTLASSSWTDDGSTSTTTGALAVNGGATLGDTSGDSHTANGSVTITNGLSVSGGNAAVTNNLSCNGNATLGNATGDAHTINGATIIATAVSDATTFGTSLDLRNATSDNAARLTFTDTTTGAQEIQIAGSRVSGGGGLLTLRTRASGDGGMNAWVTLDRAGALAHAGNTTLGDSTTVDAHSVNGSFAVGSAISGTAVTSTYAPTGATATNGGAVRAANTSTYNTSGGALNTFGVFSTVTATRASGANSLTNVALFGTASGAQVNEALRTDDGNVLLNRLTGTFTTNANTITLGDASTDATTITGIANVQNLRGKVQSVSSTGSTNLTLNADTTTLRFTGGSQIDFIGLSGGADGRIVFVENTGGGNLFIHQEHATPSAADRFSVDANTGSMLIINSRGNAILTYDGTNSRWRVYNTNAYNQGAMTVNGALDVTSTFSVAGNASIGDNSGDTHTVTGSLTVTNGMTVQSSGLTVNSGISVGDTATFGSKILASGTDPTLSSCGTSPSIIGSDTAGTVTVGTSPGATCTLTFSAAFATNPPACVFQSHMSAVPDLYISAVSTSAVTITAGAPAASLTASEKFSYHCIGVP